MTSPALRPYQVRCVEGLRNSYRAGHHAPLLQLPTGGGKTIIFAEVASGARAKNRRVLVVAHRRELIRQAIAKLDQAGVPSGAICPGFEARPDELVQVGSVQTLDRRLDRVGKFDLIIFDEAHHCRAGTWKRLIASQPSAKILGVTATPARLDGKGLGREAGGCFDDLIIGPSIRELVDLDFLAPAKCFIPARLPDVGSARMRCGDYVVEDIDRTMRDVKITGDAIAEYRRHADRMPCIVFCVSVRHAIEVADAFSEAGYRAAAVHGEMKAEPRDAAIKGLGDGSVEVLASCELISEGLDVPSVSCVILLRPTISVGLFMQQVGRGMRPAPGKTLIVLDHAGNCIRHGLPDQAREWSLADGIKRNMARRSGDTQERPTWRCVECGLLNARKSDKCADCGELKPGARVVTNLDGDLILASEIERLTYGQMLSKKLSEPELRLFAQSRGYHHGWVGHRLREQSVSFGTNTSTSGAP